MEGKRTWGGGGDVGPQGDGMANLSQRYSDFPPLSFILLVLTPLLPPLLQCLQGATTLPAFYFSETLALVDTLNLLSIWVCV